MTWTKRGSQVGDIITKPFNLAGMLTWCHNLDIEKAGATNWTENEMWCH